MKSRILSNVTIQKAAGEYLAGKTQAEIEWIAKNGAVLTDSCGWKLRETYGATGAIQIAKTIVREARFGNKG